MIAYNQLQYARSIAHKSFYGNREYIKFYKSAYAQFLDTLKRNNITYEEYKAWENSLYTWE